MASALQKSPSSGSRSPSVPQEHTFLDVYFQCLSRFSYDGAKELTDKERETSKSSASLLWSSLLNLLNTLAASEKAFYSLVFLSYNFGSRLLGRKDTLRTTYGCLLTELKKIENAHTSDVVDDSIEHLIASVCIELQHFITARIKTIGLIEQMVTLGSNRNVTYEDLLSAVTEISSSCGSILRHPIVLPLKSSFSLECETIVHLLQAQLTMQTGQYLPALMNLYSAHTKLTTWSSLITVKDAKKMGFASSQKPWSPALYDWLVKYKNALLSKFSLYFCEVLGKQSTPQEVKLLIAKTSMDFCSRISMFQKKTDAANICLVLNRQELGTTQYSGLGYHMPQSVSPADQQHTGFEVIFSCPAELSECHWLRACQLLAQKKVELDSATEKPVYRLDEGQSGSTTYFMMRTDPLITLLVVFDMKRVERDSSVVNFLTSICSDLRCVKLFAALRPGHK